METDCDDIIQFIEKYESSPERIEQRERMRIEQEKLRREALENQYPKGAPLSVFEEKFFPVDTEFNESSEESMDLLSAFEPLADEIYAYARISLKDMWLKDPAQLKHSIPEKFWEHLSDDELAKVWYSSIVQVPYHEKFSASRGKRGDPSRALLAKVRNSMWRWGHYSDDWNATVSAYNGIRNFDFGLGSESFLEHSSGYNEAGRGFYTGAPLSPEENEVYLDGAFAFLVHIKGEHKLTIGFSVSGERRILVNQVQLKQKKGNRWLFSLPKPLLSYALERLRDAFGEEWTLCLVEGEDLARQVVLEHRRLDKPDVPVDHEPSETVLERIKQFYNSPLDEWEKGETFSVSGFSRMQCKFHPLTFRGEIVQEDEPKKRKI